VAIVETTVRNIPCDTPNEAHALKDDFEAARAGGHMLRIENEGKAEWLNPDYIVGITDGTNE
jgi:hypothetical protein